MNNNSIMLVLWDFADVLSLIVLPGENLFKQTSLAGFRFKQIRIKIDNNMDLNNNMELSSCT